MTQSYQGWAFVEIMGHRSRAGRVTMDDGPLIRIDIPVRPAAPLDAAGPEEEWATEFYGRAAIFALRPCTEEAARAEAADIGDPRREIGRAPSGYPLIGVREDFDPDDEEPF